MTREAVRREVRARVKSWKAQSSSGYGFGLRQFAEAIGLPPAASSHLCTFLVHGKKPSARLLAALGYRLVKEDYEVIP